jgi:hypothetical protein
MVPDEIIVQVGAEGGSLTIEGKHYADTGWQFRAVRNEIALYDDYVDDGDTADISDFLEKSQYFDTLGEALKLFDRYPEWVHLVPGEVHPEFRDEVFRAIRSRGGIAAVERWREELYRRQCRSGAVKETNCRDEQMVIATDVALLAPVPKVHLDSAKENKMRTVAFGTDCYDVLQRLDEIRGGENGKGGENVEVYIYASGSEGRDGLVRWKGRYVGWVESVGGRHPNPTLRPPSTVTDTAWLLFWHVEDLAEIAGDGKRIGALQGYNNSKPYANSFRLRHPMIIKHPHW